MAIRFDASGDSLRITSNPLNYNADYTICGWFRMTTDTNTYTTPLGIFGATEDYYCDALECDTDGTTLMVTSNRSSGFAYTNIGSLSTATWYYLALSRSGSSLTGKIITTAGAVTTQTITKATGGESVDVMTISEWGNAGGELWNGRVCAVKAWSAALTEVEIINEMWTIAPRRGSNLYGWWPMFPGATERLADYSGNAHPWTAVGTLADEDPPPVSWGAVVLYDDYVPSSSNINGAASITLDALTASGAGTVTVSGAATPTLSALTSAATGTVSIGGVASPTLGTLTSSAAGTVAIVGASSPTLAALTLSAAGVVGSTPLNGAADITLGAVTTGAAGTVTIIGVSSPTLGTITLGAVGTVSISGAASPSLAALTLSSTGVVGSLPITGTADIALSNLTGAGAGTVSITGAASPALASLTSAAAGIVAVSGAASITLSALILTATSGLYTFGLTPAERIYFIAYSDRIYTPPGEDRIFTAAPADREYTPPNQDRTFTASRADRTYEVKRG